MHDELSHTKELDNFYSISNFHKTFYYIIIKIWNNHKKIVIFS